MNTADTRAVAPPPATWVIPFGNVGFGEMCCVRVAVKRQIEVEAFPLV